MFYNDPYYTDSITGKTFGYVDPFNGEEGTFYGVGFYGADETGFGWGSPINPNAYQNNSDTVVLYWSFKPYAGLIHNMIWEVQTDLVETFDSSELETYYAGLDGVTGPTGATGQFISGCIHKGLVVPIISLYPREQGQVKRVYWRVKGTYGNDMSDWMVSVFDIPSAIDVATRNFTLSFLPEVLYNKETTSNVYKMHDAYAKEFEELNKYMVLVDNDNYVYKVRDESITKNFGDLLDIIKPYDMKAIDYREIVKNFMSNIRSAPSKKSVSSLLHYVYGSYPEFVDIQDLATMYVGSDHIGDPDYVEPFYTWDPYSTPVVVAPIVWDSRHLAYGVVLNISDKFGEECRAIFTDQFVLAFVRKMIQAHTPIYLNRIEEE